MRLKRLRELVRTVVPFVALLVPQAAAGQSAAVGVTDEVFVGSEAEGYLRLLQVAGHVPLHPWGLRGFSVRQLRRLLPSDSLHPWAQRLDYTRIPGPGPHLGMIRPDASVIYNTGFAYGDNDGAVWAGRGLTTALRFGVSARYGPLSLVLTPEMFWAENRGFRLDDNGQAGTLAFGDARFPQFIDHPQRFGDSGYGRIEPGQSTLRLDLPLLSAGLSTANQFWGPAAHLPLILGNNAPGFTHLFVGTSEPANLWIGKLHGRITWGLLGQSEYSPVQTGERDRLMSGLVALFTPRRIEGLELGLARVYQSRWPAGGPRWEHLRRPLEPFLKVDVQGADTLSENQLVSVFGRWVLPRAGVELYGEFAREDHSWDFRDLIMQPDHSSAYMIGGRKVMQSGNGRRAVAIHAELANSRRSHLISVRPQARFYTHTQVRQGHTNRGQLLGSNAAFNGSGGVAGVDLYDRHGRWSLQWSSVTPEDRPPATPESSARMVPHGTHAIELEGLRFLNGMEVTGGLGGIVELGSYGGGDHFSLRATIGVRSAWPGNGR